MSVITKTTKELTEQFLANFESKLNQDSPLNDFAFLRVLSANQAMFGKELIKYGQNRSLQNLVLTSFGDDLRLLGAEYGVIFKEAQAASLNILVPATDGTVIPATSVFTGDPNGIRYFPDAASPPASGGFAALTATASENPGADGNLNDGETLTINAKIPGAETVATVDSTEILGVNEEEETAYQRRVLNEVRRKAGGYGYGDNRKWAEETPGVAAAYPFAGRPDIPSTVSPERTVYIEADPDIDPDGIAPPALLDDARFYLTTDPLTGQSRLTLGMTDEKLYVESIARILFYVEVRGLVYPPGQETEVKDQIEAALIAYFLSLNMFVSGLDVEEERNDTITDPSISKTVQDVLEVTSSIAIGVGFGTTPGVFLPSYRLFPGELGKLGGVTYG
jgi:hypothetical protein